MQTLDAQIRRVPAHDIQNGIFVGVECPATSDKDEARSTNAVPAMALAAFQSGLRRLDGLDCLECAASLCQIGGELAGKREPSLIEDQAVQTGLGSDVAARFCHPARHARRHFPGLQLFDDDEKARGNGEGGVMRLILPYPSGSRRDPRNASPLLGGTNRAALATARAAPRARRAFFEAVPACRDAHLSAGRSRQVAADTAVHADGRSDICCSASLISDCLRNPQKDALSSWPNSRGFCVQKQ